jgi:predicted nuclease of predicted toxin-antitoxin system
MRILLDENLPESLEKALENLGHQVDSVNQLRLKGLDNSTLYREVAQAYELCFTKDAGFAHNVRQMNIKSNVKLLRVVLPQQAATHFISSFIKAFQQTNWSLYENGSDWP